MVVVPCVKRDTKHGSMERTPEGGGRNSLLFFQLSVGETVEKEQTKVSVVGQTVLCSK